LPLLEPRTDPHINDWNYRPTNRHVKKTNHTIHSASLPPVIEINRDGERAEKEDMEKVGEVTDI